MDDKQYHITIDFAIDIIRSKNNLFYFHIKSFLPIQCILNVYMY